MKQQITIGIVNGILILMLVGIWLMITKKSSQLVHAAASSNQRVGRVTKRVRGLTSIWFNNRNSLNIEDGKVSQPTISYPVGTQVIINRGQVKIRRGVFWVYRKGTAATGGDVAERAHQVHIILPKGAKLTNLVGTTDDQVTLSHLHIGRCHFDGKTHLVIKQSLIDHRLQLKSNNGILLKRVTAATIKATSDGGNMALTSCQFRCGVSRLFSNGGSIKVTDDQFPNLRLNSGGGLMVLANNCIQRQVLAVTNGGNLKIEVPQQKQVRVVANTDGGRSNLFGRAVQVVWNSWHRHLIWYNLKTRGGDVQMTAREK